MLHLENPQRTTLSSGVHRDRNVSHSITAAGWPTPPSHMLMKQKASHWLPMSEGLQLLEMHSRKQAKSLVIPFLPLFLCLIPKVSYAALQEQMKNKEHVKQRDISCITDSMGNSCDGSCVPEWVSSTENTKRIRSIMEKCGFLALRFSEQHMEAPTCWLTDGIRCALPEKH